jgi:hypothetical protein
VSASLQLEEMLKKAECEASEVRGRDEIVMRRSTKEVTK